MTILRKPCWYKLTVRFLANVLQMHRYFFWVSLIFIKRSRNSSDLDALCLPALHTAAQVTPFNEVSLFSSFQWHDSWELHGSDNFLPSSRLIQSYCSKVLTIAATFWCLKLYGGHSSAGAFLQAIDPWGKCFNAVAVLVARWQIYQVGTPSDLIDPVISVDTFPVTDSEWKSY